QRCHHGRHRPRARPHGGPRPLCRGRRHPTLAAPGHRHARPRTRPDTHRPTPPGRPHHRHPLTTTGGLVAMIALLALTGPPGAGKTTLAHTIADRHDTATVFHLPQVARQLRQINEHVPHLLVDPDPLSRYGDAVVAYCLRHTFLEGFPDRKSTRLNSSHVKISYAVFCLTKKHKHPN